MNSVYNIQLFSSYTWLQVHFQHHLPENTDVTKCVMLPVFSCLYRPMLLLIPCTFQFLGMFTKSWKATLSFVMSVCPSAWPPAWNNLAPTGWIFMEFDVLIFYFRESAESVQVSLKSDKNNGILHEDQHTLFIISYSLLLRMGNVSDRSCREYQNTHFMFSNLFLKIVSFMR